MIYSIVRYFAEHKKSILVVVPTTSLVEQMYKDFADYGWDVESYCHKVYAGREREAKAPVVITTWQSIYKLEKIFREVRLCNRRRGTPVQVQISRRNHDKTTSCQVQVWVYWNARWYTNP